MTAPQLRIALCVITHEGTTQADWERMYNSAAPHVDGVFVGWTHQNLNNLPDWMRGCGEIEAIGDRCFIDDPDEGRVLNFGAARNANFNQVYQSPIEYDWIIWLDSDDELIHGERLRNLLQGRRDTTGSVLLKYDYAVNEHDEKSTGQHRERCLRVSAHPTWTWMVHEVCAVPPGIRMHRHDGAVSVRHWRDVFGADNVASRIRNRAILKVAIKHDPEEPRYHLYLAHEEFAEAQANINADDLETAGYHTRNALERYRAYIDEFGTTPGDDPYFANCRWAECLRLLGLNNEAVNRDLQGLKMRPQYPEAYLGITEAFANSHQWELCHQWADLALKCGIRDENYIYANDAQANAYLPHWYMAISAEALGQWDAAISAFQKAKKVSPHLKDIDAAIQRVRGYQKLTNATEKVRDQRRAGTYERSICFIARPLFEPWHPEVMKEGSGGSERCVIEIAQRFAALGWRVAVFGTPGKHRGLYSDGVEYWDAHQDWDSTEYFDIVVASRAPEVFDTEMPCKLKILWMHDVNVGPIDDGPWGNRFEKPDMILGLTNWHTNHLAKIYDVTAGKFEVAPNGFDPTEFTYTPQADKDPLKFVFASSPDRGVDTVLELWPYIRRDFPGASLDIYYGWTGIDKILERMPTHPIGTFKKGVEKLLAHVNEGDIGWHDRVPRETLAAAYQKASIWCYPTMFCETYCITALEMQVSGVLPATSNLAGLKETVFAPWLRIEGMPNNDDYRRRYMKLLHTIIETPIETREEWADVGFRWASERTWDAAFARWLELIDPFVSTTPTQVAITTSV